MSLLCRKVFGALVLSLSVWTTAWAQQTYFVPTVEARAEWNSNREMFALPALEDPTMGYLLNALALWGWQTQRSELELRPRIQFQEFPDREGIDPVEYFLDVRAGTRTLKSETTFLARYALQDNYNAEYGNAGFDEFDPDNPNVTDGGIVFVGGTRETIEGEVSSRYQFSQLMAVSGLISYEKIDYEENIVTQRVGYESPYAELMLVRALGPVAELAIGPYASRSTADDGSNETDTLGVKVGLSYNWSETMYFSVNGLVERDDITVFIPTRTEETINDWGLEFAGLYRRELGSVRYAIGRYLTPSTFGTRTTQDQIRVQYIQPLSPLLTFNGSVRMTRDERIGNADNAQRDRAIAELSLIRQITPTWYISGGYRYTWQDLDQPGGSADNNTVFIKVGYRGLDSRRAKSQ